MSLGLLGQTSPDAPLEDDVREMLSCWIDIAIALKQTLQDRPQDRTSPADFIRAFVVQHCEARPFDLCERTIALSIGVFCWCDLDEVLTAWCEALSHDLDTSARHGISLFTTVLRSFLQEPPGRTVWLPLKRKTTIAALEALSPSARCELQQSQHALMSDGEPFRTATAIACQLPWYSSASQLAHRHPNARTTCRTIGALHGAAFGTIAFHEARRTVYQPKRHGLAVEIAPLWQAWTGSANASANATDRISSPLAFAD